MFRSKLKQSWEHFLSIYWAYFILLILLFLISFSIFFHTKPSHISINHRLKRQISNRHDRQHDTEMLRRMLLHRTNSSVLTDCSTNMANDGIYQLPSPNTLPTRIIRLIEQTFQPDLQALNRTADKIRMRLSQLANDDSLDKFPKDSKVDLRILLATHPRLKEIDVRINWHDNGGGSEAIKYTRLPTVISHETTDYETINENLVRQDQILQNFASSNVRETLKSNSEPRLLNTGWWIGPVFCEKNKNEAFMMVYILPLTNDYFLATYLNISSVDINQCANNDAPFGGTHKCPDGMECVHQPGRGFTLGAYDCLCKGSHSNATFLLDGNELEWNETIDRDKAFLLPLNSCECNPQLCQVKYNQFLRTIIIVIQSIFIVFVAILAGIVFQRRKIKIIKHSMWILLELVLLGAALLYASVIVDSFGPYGTACLIMPWLRELGFTIVYGTLILRIYKMLAEFQSRKAHCVQVKEKDILRILFFISISIIGYLLGWTFVNIDHTNEKLSLDDYLLGEGQTFRDRRWFRTCRPRSWDYLVQIAEFIFLCVGIRFIYSTRTAPCEYHERKLITIVIVCEMLFSTLLHVIKDCLWASMDPNTYFLLSFFRCHCTVTCMIVFIFCTKLCFIFRPYHDEYPGRERFRSIQEGLEPTDLVTKLQSNGDIEFGELNIRDMDPEEIRAELKRLYTSLHVLKTKTMRKDNPHLTKRHGQRRKNRRFSMQAFQRHTGGTPSTGVGGTLSSILSGGGGGGGGDKHDHDPTKTPEDSTDDAEETRGRALSDAATPSTGVGQRVTFK